MLSIHTAGELHPAPAIEGRVTFTFNLSELLDDPAHKPGAELVKLDGTDPRVQDFVFATDGAQALYEAMLQTIVPQVERGKSVVVLILCRGGKHRSVAFGEVLVDTFASGIASVTHHHKHLDRVTVKAGQFWRPDADSIDELGPTVRVSHVDAGVVYFHRNAGCGRLGQFSLAHFETTFARVD